MSSIEIIRLVAPEFESISDDQLALWVSLAEPYINKEKFGKFYEQALAYLVCHMMTTAGLADTTDQGELGMLTSLATSTYGIGSISAGSSSISFTNGGATGAVDADAEFLRTKYGIQYVTLRKLCIIPITIA